MGNANDYAHLLRHIVVFAVACRTENFTRAAEELGISRVAVSRKIGELESYLGSRLFERSHRSVHPTKSGAELEAVVNPALTKITDALDRVREPSPARRLKVTVTAAFANFWLMPRLTSFSTDHSLIEIDLAVSDRYLDLKAEGIDVAIRYDGYSELGAVPLTREVISPVWSPDYKPRTAMNTPRDLLSEHLLQLGGRYRPTARWEYWFSERGLNGVGAIVGTQFDSYVTMLQAAIEGQGVALAGNPLVDSFLASGRLMRMETAPPLQREIYWLILRSADRPETIAFANWIRAFFPESPEVSVS